MNARQRRWSLLMLAAIVVVTVAGEYTVRALGYVDFPLYDADAVIGYAPAADQQGWFRNRNHWQFNAQHMGAPPFVPGPAPNILLIGDSIVLGGNTYAENERLGPILQSLLRDRGGGTVWPVGAGSWALANELAWLHRYAGVVAQMDRIVLVLNSADFGEASSWTCERSHPRRRPWFALGYLIDKYLLELERCDGSPAALRVPPGDLATTLAAYGRQWGSRSQVLLYPRSQERGDPALWLRRMQAPRELLRDAGFPPPYDLMDESRWSETLYRDTFHPTAEGNRALAGVLANLLQARDGLGTAAADGDGG